MSKEEFYKYGESLGIKVNDLQRLKMLADKCQQDMANKKYTEKQLLDAMSFAECYIIEHDKPLFLKSDGKPVPDCLDFIKSLNKQY